MKLCVVGSGIIGLSTANEILSQFPNSDVTILSEKFGEETTSFGAAGIFRPGGGFRVSGDSNGEMCKNWVKNSYDHYNSILTSADAPSLHGVKAVSGYIFSTNDETTKNKLLQDILPVYRPMKEDELTICPGNWEYGSYFTTMVIDASIHLKWLTTKLQDRVNVRRAKIQSLKELADYDYVFNCTGLGAKWLCDDDHLTPIRGQVFKVRAPWIKMFYYSNSDTYIIPGMNLVTLGGTRQYDNYNTDVDHHDSAGIWERCTQLVPNLKSSQIIKEWSGLRPYRDNGVRSEIEIIKDGSRQIKVIHNYGHGGYGITFAPGSCKHSVSLMTESHRGIWRIWRSKI